MKYYTMEYYDYLKKTGDPGRYDTDAEDFKRDELREELREEDNE